MASSLSLNPGFVKKLIIFRLTNLIKKGIEYPLFRISGYVLQFATNWFKHRIERMIVEKVEGGQWNTYVLNIREILCRMREFWNSHNLSFSEDILRATLPSEIVDKAFNRLRCTGGCYYNQDRDVVFLLLQHMNYDQIHSVNWEGKYVFLEREIQAQYCKHTDYKWNPELTELQHLAKLKEAKE